MPSKLLSPAELLDTAVTLAHGAGAILLEGLTYIRAGNHAHVRYKSSPGDVVTEYDQRSEAFIVSELRRRYPDHAIVGEEGGAYDPQAAETQPPRYEWQIDPLDGTTNFSHGFGLFCVSIGLLIDGIPVLGAVYNPAADELYAAAHGLGATCNGKPIHVSRVNSLQQALLITGFPYDYAHNPRNNLRAFDAFNRRCQAVRRIGSAALDLCFVAAGQIDGYWEANVKAYDIAAGIAIVREAGGLVTDSAGEDAMLSRGEIVASNGLLQPAMLDVLREVHLSEAAHVVMR
ncbi:MAG: inositol monophosphatase family protein [Anaerolineae bacterium]|nr:inositol monophosphatase [Thermoflexales bacterium]MDW8406254.1 inositol monophosphatase family protein [Anaerolineae bacterium]